MKLSARMTDILEEGRQDLVVWVAAWIDEVAQLEEALDRARANIAAYDNSDRKQTAENAALESDLCEAYGKMNILIQRELAQKKLVVALEADNAALQERVDELREMLDFAHHLQFIDDTNTPEETTKFWRMVEKALEASTREER